MLEQVLAAPERLLLAGIGMLVTVGAAVGRLVARPELRLIGEFGGMPAEEDNDVAPQPRGAVTVEILDWPKTGERRERARRTS